MSDNVQQSVETVLQIKDLATQVLQKASEAAEKLKGNFDRLHKEDPLMKFREGLSKMNGVQEAGGKIKEMAFELAGAAGVALSAKAAFEKFIDTNAESETAARELGATFADLYTYGKKSKDPFENFEKGVKRSTDVVEEFSKASFDLGIPSAHFAAMAKTLAPSVAHAGKGTKDLQKLTIDLAKIARGTGRDYETMAQQVMLASRGMVRRGSFLDAHGITTKVLAPLSEAQRMQKIMSAVQLMNPDSMVKVKTYADLVATVKARVEGITEAAGKPVFEKAKSILKEAADWLANNRKEVEHIAGIVANKMVKGMELAVDAIKAAYKYWDEIKAVVEVIVIALTAKKVFTTFSEMRETAEGLHKMASALNSIKIGDWKNTAGNFGKLAALGMVAEAAMVGYAIGSAINAWLVKQPWFETMMKPTDKKFDSAMAEGEKQKQFYDQRQAAIKEQATIAAKLIGHGATMESVLLDYKRRIEAGGNIGVGSYAGYKTSANDKGIGLGELSQALGMTKGGGPGTLTGKPEEASDERVNHINDFRNSQFNITQQFAEGFDPDRIALAFSQDVANLGEMRSSSAHAHPLAGVG